MTGWRFVTRSLRYYWRIHVAVALGVAAATAVLTGALLIGDSVRGSLRQLALDRLGRIEEALVTNRFFHAELAEELAGDDRFQQFFGSAEPVILFPHGTVERQGSGSAGRASAVLIVGCDDSFWSLGEARVKPDPLPGPREIVLNRPLAKDLGVTIGEEVILRLPKSNQVPADSPLANKSDRIRSLAGLTVVDIIPAESLGQFGLRASQTLPRNAFVSRTTIQNALDQAGKVNAVLVAGKVSGRPLTQLESEAASLALSQLLRPSFEDYGFVLKHVRRTYPSGDSDPQDVIFDYFSLTTDRMIFSSEAESAATRAFADDQGQAVLTYLANSIETTLEDQDDAGVSIPYSMIAAIDPSANFQLHDSNDQPIGSLGDEEIVLNSWAARDLDVRTGDKLRVRFFEPETTHGHATEAFADFTLKAVTPLTEPARPYGRKRAAVYEQRPTLANDPDLTPEVEGVTDQETISDWDPPFPFDYQRVRSQDDEYWANHRTTPKAFISLAAGQRLWNSRFGKVTSVRIPAADGVNEENLKAKLLGQLARDGTQLGFEFLPVKRRQLEAAQGTTPFDGLFLALSFFVIAAALMLVALLFRLGVEQRAGELGTLLAVGLRRRRAGRLLVLEGTMVALLGGTLGVAIGIGYARLMLFGLRTWWVGAITTPFLRYHDSLRSLALGYILGVVVCSATIAWSVFGTRRISVCRLLAGQTSDVGQRIYKPQHLLTGIAIVLLIAALGLSFGAVQLSGMAQAGTFVGGAAVLLASLLLLIWGKLKRGGAKTQSSGFGAWAFAARNAARNPSRSATTIGLMATATFLIVAMSSFRLEPSAKGTGGFDLVAESSEPVFEDLNSQPGREEVLADQAHILSGGALFGLRLRAGDDASCNNLYRPAQPRVLGVTAEFMNHFSDPAVTSFSWASTAAETEEDKANPWRLLFAPAADDAIPVVIDMSTAMYSLKPPVRVGGIYEATYDEGQTLRFRVVGLVEYSILHGALVISEPQFQRHFPQISGYRYFLVQSPPDATEQVATVLEERLGDQGFDAIRANTLLERLLAVQNTYLSTFQSLGALGLLLGTFGLATVQLRNVLERRGELALLRATGFRRRRLAWLVLSENAMLLLAGLATGVAAALLAVLPHKFAGDGAIPLTVLGELGAMLGTVFLVGVVASVGSVRATLRAPVLAALREE